MAVAVGFATVAVLGIADVLPGEIVAALKPVEEVRARDDQTGGLSLVHVDRPPEGVARGMQLALLALLLGGAPAALLAAVLLRWPNAGRPRWDGRGNACLAGFVFQLSSVVVTALLLVLILLFAYDEGLPARELFTPVAILFVLVATGVWGLRSWRLLQSQAQRVPSTMPLGGSDDGA